MATRTWWYGAALLASAFLLVACGGGSGASPAPRSALTPGSPVVLSRFSVESVPAGLAVTAGTTRLGLTQPPGAPPLVYEPNFSGKTLPLAIQPGNGAPPFVYLVDQTANGEHTILYDQTTDSPGSLGAIAASALGRSTPARAIGAGEPRFPPPSLRGLPLYSTTRLAVTYEVSALRSGTRGAAEVERDLGAARSVELGFARAGRITRVVDVAPSVTSDALAERLRARPEVVAVEPVQLRYAASAPPFLPDDTHFDDYEQWDMFDVFAPNAWSYTRGSPLDAPGASGVSIAVLDTGADVSHRDLAGKIVYAESVIDGVVRQGARAVQDTDGHGTNVAGIAAAATDNAYGFAGAGFATTLQVYKIFADRTGSNRVTTDAADEAQAIYDAVARGARIINMSLAAPQGSAGFNALERDAVEYAIAHGVSVVAAAGNDRARGATTVEYPAAYDGVVSVGATALDDALSPDAFAGATEHVASYSNSGPNLTLVAPGGDPPAAEQTGHAALDALHWIENIYTTTPADANRSCLDAADCRAFFAGTSQAAPLVSGTIALMLALDPSLTPQQIVAVLEATSDDIHDPNQGRGRLDAYRALAAVSGDAAGVPLPGRANFVAFAYVPNGTNVPRILDVTYPHGVAVAGDGTFRVADVPAGARDYEIGVWADLNGDGRVDAGDYFGTSGSCPVSAPCGAANGVVAHPVAAGFVLP